jgi:hypothetical protein
VANYQTRVSPEQLFQMETMEKISAWVELANNLYS